MWSRHVCCLAVLAVSNVWGRTVSSSQGGDLNSLDDNHVKSSLESPASNLLSDIRFLYRIYEECSVTDLSSCLKMKLVVAMDRVAKSTSSFKIFEGVSFVKDPNAPMDSTVPLIEKELESNLPRALHERENTLDKLIIEKLYTFFQTHSLQFRLLAMEDVKRSFMSEGEARGKRKGLNSLMLVSMLLGGTLIPLKFGALALLAGKALIISKLALALAAIIGLKKLVGGGGGGHDSYQVLTVPHHGGGHYKRSIRVQDGSNLPYRAYEPRSFS